MPEYRFVVNLRTDTISPEYINLLPPWGYLLAPGNASAQLRQQAQILTADGYKLFADNGNFTHINDLVQQYRDEAAVLRTQIKEEETQLGRRARSGDLSSILRRDCTQLAKRVRQSVKQLAQTGDLEIADQITLLPSHLIGVEDITLATWLALNLEPSYLNYDRSHYRRWNSSVARRARKRLKSLNGLPAENYYPVASALSYNTAYDAGRVFAQNGLQRASMGFGAYMADDDYIDHYVLGRRHIPLPVLMPHRYLRTCLAALGFWDGYRQEAGSPPDAFHFLGLGAPIMIGLVALVAWDTPLLTFDATSPIRDAVEGTLYTSKPSYLKVRTRRFAYRLASSSGREWMCPCPFCQAFTAVHPFDYAAGTNWFQSTMPIRVTRNDLSPGGGLYDAYPLLSEPRRGSLRTEVNFARMGHNHWVLQDIVASLQASSDSRANLVAYLEDIVSRYEETTNSNRFAAAVRFAFKIAVQGIADG